jgi:hypothetical protein
MSVNKVVRLLYLLPALALLGGCGGGSAVPSQAPVTGPGLSEAPIMPQANHYGNDAFIVTAQLYGNDASVYTRSGFNLTLKQTLTQDISAPQGAVTTPNNFLYITNGGHSNVLVYKVKGKTFPQYPTNTLDDYGQMPVNVSATADRNLVAVSNYSTTSGGAGSVSIYLKRQSEPTRVLTYGTDTLQGEGVAIDHQGNCFWSYNDPNTNGGSIVEFTGCNGYGSVIVSGLTNAQGIVFDQSGDLYYVDQAFGIYKCVKTSNCVLWAANGPSGYGFGLPTNINFDYKAKALWLADASGYIWAISIKGHCGHGKSGGLCVYQYTSQDGDPFGIAPIRGD